jgi:hypothetical protein
MPGYLTRERGLASTRQAADEDETRPPGRLFERLKREHPLCTSITLGLGPRTRIKLLYKHTLIICELSAFRAASEVTGWRWVTATMTTAAAVETNKPRENRGLRHRLSQAVTR